jgi:putative oxidoreductase
MRLFWPVKPGFLDGAPAVGLLFLRLIAGIGMVLHGQGKIQTPFSWMGPDAPVPGILQALAALSEVGGGLALIFGFLTPLACLGIMSTMFVAALKHIQEGGSFIGKGSYELPALYFVIALTLLLTGPGVLSLDKALFGRKRR